MAADPGTREHYAAVVRGWRHFMGNHLHVGYFESEKDDLQVATDKLVKELARWGELPSGARVLDVGCGFGEPALLLARQFGCQVVGISPVAAELAEARRRVDEAGLLDAVSFRQADAQDPPFDDESFDVVWLMESPHLIPDKAQLFQTTFRLLCRGGKLLLCDFSLQRAVTAEDVLRNAADIAKIERAFGKVRSRTLEETGRTLRSAGFNKISARDVTAEVRPTVRCWLAAAEAFEETGRHLRDDSSQAADVAPDLAQPKLNSTERSEETGEKFSGDKVEEFVQGCEAMERLFEAGILGYGFARARKGDCRGR